jgi:hypothetical protein
MTDRQPTGQRTAAERLHPHVDPTGLVIGGTGHGKTPQQQQLRVAQDTIDRRTGRPSPAS